MTDTNETPAVDAAADETPEATPAPTFAEEAQRLFATPFPSFDDPVIITAEALNEWRASAAEYAETGDPAALAKFHARQAQEWGREVAREYARSVA